MKRTLVIIATVFMTSIVFISCNDNSKKEKPIKIKEELSNSSKTDSDNYKPGDNWKLTWSDEFNASEIDSKNWSFQIEEAGKFNGEWQRYTNSSNNAYVEDNCLVIKAIHEGDSHGMNKYTSARLHTANKQSWKYGKIVARIKLPKGEGLWPAFWMLGANINENGGDTPWPQCGEIDILELYGSKDDGVVESNIHYANKLDKHTDIGASSYKLKEGKFADDFHVFELEWNETELKWLVDGEEYVKTPITSKEHLEFHKEFFILFNIAVGGTYAGRPNETTEFPQKMFIDWVRVYKKN